MFKQLFNDDINVNANEIYIERLENLDNLLKMKCITSFPEMDNMNALTIWTVLNNQWYFLGYILYEYVGINQSKFFETAKSAYNTYGGANPEEMAKLRGIHITGCLLDNRLNNQECLRVLFIRLACLLCDEAQTQILWMDGCQEMKAHPIRNDYKTLPEEKLGLYYANAFMNDEV